MQGDNLGESHKKYSTACQKEVAEMSKHPLSHEEFLAQIEKLFLNT